MNQHASRPVAQGFPLHRRMHGPIQPAAGPRTTTQLRPSNPSVSMTNGGPLRRSLFKSQIPIRTGFGTERSVPQASQQPFLQTQSLEQRRQLFASTPQNSTALQPMRTSSSTSQQQQQQSIEVAFKVYEDRLQLYLGDFRAMCLRLIMQEQEEKEKWHSLCLKMMKERDTARQRVSALISEREGHLSSSPPTAALASSNEQLASKASKRTRDESGSVAQESIQELPSRSSPVESSRPIRSLRSSPIPSPPGSPSASLYNSSSTAINSSSLPSSTSSPSPLSPNATVPPMSATPCSSPVNLVNITTFNPIRSPNDKTCFDVFGVVDIPESRPVKRRKSYDSSLSDKKTEGGETKDSSGPSQNDAEAPVPCPFSIAHTDIMYIPMKGRLSCRACLLEKTTNPSSSRNPKTFPTNVFWDELRDHCVNEHPVACADVARLCPADLNELRRRLYNI